MERSVNKRHCVPEMRNVRGGRIAHRKADSFLSEK